jgi:hypothetical protein
MRLIDTVPVHGGGSEVRIFRCPDCNHELRLTVWRHDVPASPADPASHTSPLAPRSGL